MVRVNEEDLETYVRDLEFAIARARELPFVSADELGVVGMDMGGMAGVLLTMRRPDVDVFVGLPSGILFEHPSGLPRISPGYDPLALRVPWLQIMPVSGATAPPGAQSPSLFEAAVHSDRYLLLTPNLGHADVTIDGLIDGRGPMIAAYQQATPTGVEGHRALDPYVLNFLTAFLAPEAERRAAGLAFMARPPADAPGFKMTLEHRPALPESITYEEFVAAVVAGNGAEAVDLYLELRPDVVTLDITMPEKDGMTALREILGIDPAARVIMCSALGQESKVLESIKAGARDFVVKPFQPDRVLDSVGRLAL